MSPVEEPLERRAVISGIGQSAVGPAASAGATWT